MEELLALCRKVSLEGKYDIEFDYSGVVDRVSVYIYDSKRWNKGPGINAIVYRINNVNISQDLIPVINKVKEYLA